MIINWAQENTTCLTDHLELQERIDPKTDTLSTRYTYKLWVYRFQRDKGPKFHGNSLRQMIACLSTSIRDFISCIDDDRIGPGKIHDIVEFYMQTNQGSSTAQNLSFEVRFGRLILIFAILFGAAMRFLPTLLTSFPVLDGGMFYVTIDDVLSNNWRLPATITYNQQNIPFAYPPFGFYTTALIEKVSGLDRMDLLRFLPPLYSLLAVLALYYLAYTIFEKPFLAALAAALYALIPLALWQVYGGGITRAPGIIFSIMTLTNFYAISFKGHHTKKWLVILFGSLTILSHPEAIIHTPGICLWFLLAAPKKRYNLIQGLEIVTAILLLTSPWWITLLLRYGIEPIRLALGPGSGKMISVFLWPLFNFADEQFLPIITIAALCGLIAKIYQKSFFLPVWFCIDFILFTRNASTYALVPLVLLASVTIGELLPSAIAAMSTTNMVSENNKEVTIISITKGLVGIVIIYALASAFWWGLQATNNKVLSTEHQIAMQWVRTSTPADARFLLLTGDASSGSDEAQEWFPVLSERVSVTTVQGKEWLPTKRHARSTEQLQAECPMADVACIEDWGIVNQIEYDYIYVVKFSNNPYGLPIINSLSRESDYKLVYTSSEKRIYIYQRQNR